jgi:hypothetical protein
MYVAKKKKKMYTLHASESEQNPLKEEIDKVEEMSVED